MSMATAVDGFSAAVVLNAVTCNRRPDQEVGVRLTIGPTGEIRHATAGSHRAWRHAAVVAGVRRPRSTTTAPINTVPFTEDIASQAATWISGDDIRICTACNSGGLRFVEELAQFALFFRRERATPYQLRNHRCERSVEHPVNETFSCSLGALLPRNGWVVVIDPFRQGSTHDTLFLQAIEHRSNRLRMPLLCGSEARCEIIDTDWRALPQRLHDFPLGFGDCADMLHLFAAFDLDYICKLQSQLTPVSQPGASGLTETCYCVCFWRFCGGVG